MISDKCKIENGTRDLDAILKESKKVAVYNQLNDKQTMQLRLLCEELDGMLPNIIDEFDGELWIEFSNGVCKVTAELCFAEFSSEKKSELVNIAKDKKNAYAVGLVGKIRSVLEDLFLDKDAVYSYNTSTLFNYGIEYSVGMEYSAYTWNLGKYKEAVKEENKTEWDELEKSIIANLADDVTVGVKGRQAKIVVTKKFA